MRKHVAMVGSLFAGAAMLTAVAVTPASAAPTASAVVLSPTSLDFTAIGQSAPVVAGLDSNCPNVIDASKGQAFDISATGGDGSVATVTRTSSVGSRQNCADTINFSVTAVGCGTTTWTFLPVVVNKNNFAEPGLQKKVQSTTFTVTVTDPNCVTTPPPSGGQRAAAPAVANAYINANGARDSFTLLCTNGSYKKFGKTWRGALINDVAAGMPKPESIKDDTSYFPTDGDWSQYVIDGVTALCSGSSPSAAFPAPTPAA